MADKPKCNQCHERDVFSKGLCSGCYGKNWRLARKAERDAAIAEQFPPKQLTSGVTEDELAVIEGEIVHDDAPKVPETHLVATDPVGMKAAQQDVRAWAEQKLTVLERDIIEANAALNEARKNGWATGALTSARNRAVDDETFYNKILAAVEAGHTIIPEFPISVFAVRAASPESAEQHTWMGHVDKKDVWLSSPVSPDSSPAGAGIFRNPVPEVYSWNGSLTKDKDGREYRPYTIRRTGNPAGPIVFPNFMARSELMRATSVAMAERCFDQIGVCLPIASDASTRRVQESKGKAGDPMVIGQIVHRNKRKVVSFIIAWYLNLEEL